MHTSLTLTQSQVKIKVTELLKSQKLHLSKSCLLCHFGVELKTDGNYDNIGPSLQLVSPIFEFPFR